MAIGPVGTLATARARRGWIVLGTVPSNRPGIELICIQMSGYRTIEVTCLEELLKDNVGECPRTSRRQKCEDSAGPTF
jgi:hypothetical protein